MKNFLTDLDIFAKTARTSLAHATNQDELEAIRITLLGRKGQLTNFMGTLKDLSLDEKREAGPLLNNIKLELEQVYYTKRDELFRQILAAQEEKSKYFDCTAYQPNPVRGSLHPYTQLTKKIVAIFTSLGYHVVDGPEVETEFRNFEALNIPANHPARDMQDTFWIDVPGMLLRTQTSTMEIRAMQEGKLPLAVVTPGRVYRQEATDASHDFMFQQFDALVIDKNISMAHLLGTIKTWFQLIFDNKNLDIRIRPGYFPFVEPGIEVDMTCPFCTTGCSTCKKTRWIEMGGAGLTHPNVLRAGGIDPSVYRGFAFGFGLTRMAMLVYNINDIRLLHSSNKNFLEQF